MTLVTLNVGLVNIAAHMETSVVQLLMTVVQQTIHVHAQKIVNNVTNMEIVNNAILDMLHEIMVSVELFVQFKIVQPVMQMEIVINVIVDML